MLSIQNMRSDRAKRLSCFDSRCPPYCPILRFLAAKARTAFVGGGKTMLSLSSSLISSSSSTSSTSTIMLLIRLKYFPDDRCGATGAESLQAMLDNVHVVF